MAIPAVMPYSSLGAKMMGRQYLPALSSGSKVKIPEVQAKIEDYVSRWSNTQVSLPAAVITPTTEEDVVPIVKCASEQGMKVIPASETVATFDTIDLDEEAGTVTFSGGVIVRDVIRTLSEKGWYTSVPNSNAVGMVGYCLGGGSSSFNGLKGLAIDNIIHVTMVTASGKVVELSPESQNEEGKLFNVLCGAGFGLGVITSLTISAWRIKDLQMNEDKIWTRKLVFPPPAIGKAAELFSELQHPWDPRLMSALLFMRAPPSAPRPGAPVILLNVSFLGSSAEAEQAAAVTFEEHYKAVVVVAETSATPLSAMHDMAEPLNRHGDYKEMYAAWLSDIIPEQIIAAFQCWQELSEQVPEAKATSYFVLAAKNTKGMLENDVEGKKLFPRTLRRRSIFAQVVPWWTTETVEEEARAWGKEMLKIVDAPQHDEAEKANGEERISAWAANLSKGIDLTTVWSEAQREEIKRVKELWDPKVVFGNPVTDGV